MTYDQLLTLDAIIKTGSFKAASKRLHKTQPSISTAIKKLEDEFQVQLFDREGYRPVLTKEGELFYNKAKLALFHMQSLNALGEELAMGIEPEIRVSMDAICPSHMIFPSFRDFFKHHLQTDLNFSVDVINGSRQKVLNHEVDIALYSMLPGQQLEEELEGLPLWPIKMIPVYSSDFHPSSFNDLDELRKFPQVIIKSTGIGESPNYGILDGGRKWYVTELQTKRDIIEAGLGWGSLPDHLIKNELEKGKFQPIALPGIEIRSTQIYMVRNRNQPLGPVAKQLWNQFKKLFN